MLFNKNNSMAETHDRLIGLIKNHYCIVDEHGAIAKNKLDRCVQVLMPQYETSNDLDFPCIDGVPYLHMRIENFEQLREAMPRICELVHNDKELLALSFNNPLRMAVDKLGIELTPPMARAIRSLLKKTLRFDDEETATKRKSGIKKIKWVAAPAKTKPSPR
jgi:hypothetical protein